MMPTLDMSAIANMLLCGFDLVLAVLLVFFRLGAVRDLRNSLPGKLQ
jgi:hypothetical protein